MRTCKSCDSEYDDALTICPSCGVQVEGNGARRGDESVLSKDNWGANDSNPPSSGPQATQQLLPGKAPLKKVRTEKQKKDSYIPTIKNADSEKEILDQYFDSLTGLKEVTSLLPKVRKCEIMFVIFPT